MGLSRAVSVGIGVLAFVVTASAQQRPGGGGSPARSGARSAAGDVDHGRYLVERVLMCVECHSPRDGQGEIIPGREYTGGPIPLRPPWPNDWAERAPRNRGLPGYSNELALRLLMEGAIDREGRRLRPPMPAFRMNREDASGVVAFMVSLR